MTGPVRADEGRTATVASRPAEAAPDAARQDVWRLYERRHADMVRFAAFLTGDVHAAEDIAQEAFVRLLAAWEGLSDHDRADAYLRVTIVNLVRGDHRRRATAMRRTRPHLSLVASAEDDALGRVGRQHVLDAVSALPLRQRACVVMRHWMRMSESEIAENLGLSVGSVRTHVKRGTASLQRTLGDLR
jgi:RNA polymerase sigma-70 factor (ECF subfamily)